MIISDSSLTAYSPKYQAFCSHCGNKETLSTFERLDAKADEVTYEREGIEQASGPAVVLAKHDINYYKLKFLELFTEAERDCGFEISSITIHSEKYPLHNDQTALNTGDCEKGRKVICTVVI
jgi:hypothetical protein